MLANLREEIAILECEGIVEEGSVEEIQIPLQLVGKQANVGKLTAKQKKLIKGQQLLRGRKRRQEERFGYRETPTRSRRQTPL